MNFLYFLNFKKSTCQSKESFAQLAQVKGDILNNSYRWLNFGLNGRLIVLLLMFFNLVSYGQEGPTPTSYFPTLKMIEPTAAGFSRLTTCPMRYSNGLPQIEIPIYTIKSGDLSLDLKLTYQGGGIKLSDDASWVGLGWNLFYGGTISREVNGFPDELENMGSMPNVDIFLTGLQSSPYDYSKVPFYDRFANRESSAYSFMPDVYYYSTPKNSGSFVLGKGNQPVFIPFENALISNVNSTSSVKPYTLTSSDGMKYTFADADYTYTLPGALAYPDYVSTWHINSIVSPSRRDTIRMEYQNDGYVFRATGPYYQGFWKWEYETANPDYNSPESGFIPLTQSISRQGVKSVKPLQITFKGGKVLFFLSDRKDIYSDMNTLTTPNTSLKKLEKIVVQRLSSTSGYVPYKIFKFKYSYFGNDKGADLTDNLRLKLESVYEYNFDESDSLLVASFTYNEGDLPSKKSFSEDYWGYYNGKNNSTPIQRTTVSTSNRVIEFGDADRSAAESYTKIGTIDKVYTNTGGYSRYFWELNRSFEKPSGIVDERKYISLSSNYTSNHSTTLPIYFPIDCGQGVSFTIKEKQSIYISYSSSLLNATPDHVKFDRASISIYGDDPIFKKFGNEFGGNETILLEPGTYHVGLMTNCSNVNASIKFSYTGNDDSDEGTNNYKVGGLRIAKIGIYDKDGSLKQQKRYTYLDNNNFSSGFIASNPTKYFVNVDQAISGYRPDGFSLTCYPRVKITTTVSSTPVNGAFSNSVTYKKVQEYFDEALTNVSRIEYEYDFASDEVFKKLIMSNSWGRGRLLRKTVFDKNSSILEEESNFYSTNICALKAVGFILDRYYTIMPDFCNNQAYPLYNIYNPSTYGYSSCWSHLDSTKHIQYLKDVNNVLTPVACIKKYSYDGGLLNINPTVVTTQNRQKTASVLYRFPTDFKDALNSTSIADTTVNADVVKYMIEENAISSPLEVVKRDDGKVTSAFVISYLKNKKLLLPYKYNIATIKTPLEYKGVKQPNSADDSKTYYSSSIISSNGTYTFLSDDNFEDSLSTQYAYDKRGYVSQVKSKGSYYSSFLFDSYGNLKFESSNAKASSIAFSSFEDNDRGGWTYTGQPSVAFDGRTGDYSYSLTTGDISKMLNSLDKYKVTFWLKDGSGTCNIVPNMGNPIASNSFNGWSRYQYAINGTNSVKITGYGTVDDLLVEPAEANSTAYNLTALVGVTSKTDPLGITSYYGYDEFGRLASVKNSRGEYISQYDYNLANPNSPTCVLNLGSPSLSYTSTGGTQTETISSNSTYSITSNTPWITVSTSMASGNGSIGITCSSNNGGARNGSVTIQSTPTNGSIIKTVTVTQAGSSFLNASSSQLNFDWLQGSQTVNISSSPSWNITSKVGSYITATKVDEQTLRMQCSKNAGSSYRNGSVTLSNGTQSVVITVTQATNPDLYPQID